MHDSTDLPPNDLYQESSTHPMNHRPTDPTSPAGNPPKESFLPTLGLRTGVGLVVANMIGAGVFLSAGYMAQDLGPGLILLSWVVGTAVALCGARTYAEIATIVGKSGGEYRYLSDLLHPSLGYLAGWASLLIGFSASISVDALAAGAFLQTLIPITEPRLFAALLIIALTASHALRLDWSKWTQNSLVIVKLCFVLGFIALGLSLGSSEWPVWEPPIASEGFPLGAFLENQYWVAFAFSGWNAAIYAASEFKQPKRDVPRAMLVGCLLVASLYILVNWVFVSNLTPEQAFAVAEYETTRITLGHLVIEELLGAWGGIVMSICAVIAFTSALSAMTFVGPRVYSEMAKDGFLPKLFAGKPGQPPIGAIFLQSSVAIGLLFTQTLIQMVQSVSAILMIFSGLIAFAVFWVRFRRPDLPRPSNVSLITAAIYMVAMVVLLYYGLQQSNMLLMVLTGIVCIAGIAWSTSRLRAKALREKEQPVSL